MKNTSKYLSTILLATLAAPSVLTAASIVTDDFSSTTITNENRLRVRDTADDWVKSGGNATADASEWAITGGVLTNPGTTAGVASEAPVFKLLDVNAAALPDYTELTYSFNYTVGTGSTLYFYTYGYFNGTLTSGSQLHNTGVANGTIQSQYDSSGDFLALDLIDGSDKPESDRISITGTGVYSLTVDLTAAGYEEINNINDLQLLMVGFASNMTTSDGSGAITIDNFEFSGLVVPEPSSTALLGLGGLALLLRRRK